MAHLCHACVAWWHAWHDGRQRSRPIEWSGRGQSVLLGCAVRTVHYTWLNGRHRRVGAALQALHSHLSISSTLPFPRPSHYSTPTNARVTLRSESRLQALDPELAHLSRWLHTTRTMLDSACSSSSCPVPPSTSPSSPSRPDSRPLLPPLPVHGE